MIIKYFIPEDGDDQSHPNVFIINGNQPPTVHQIIKVFTTDLNLVMVITVNYLSQ